MVYRVYVSKKTEYAGEDRSLFNDLKSSLGIKGLRKVKVYNRYDIEGVDKETFETAVQTIFPNHRLTMLHTPSKSQKTHLPQNCCRVSLTSVQTLHSSVYSL